MPEEKILFLHIPKTGGSTLRYTLQRLLPELHRLHWHWTHWMDHTSLDEMFQHQEFSSARYLFGHFTYGLHELFEGPCRYITFLRRPENRVWSGFHHLRRDTKATQHEMVKRMTFTEYLHSGLVLDSDNGQIRRLSGVGDTVPYGELSDDHLQKAIENLEAQFLFVGLTEHYDASMLSIADKLQLSSPVYWRQNRGRNKPEKPMTDNEKEAVRACNHLDVQLYQIIKEGFPTPTAAQIKRFQRVNWWYNFMLFPEKVFRKLDSLRRRSGQQ